MLKESRTDKLIQCSSKFKMSGVTICHDLWTSFGDTYDCNCCSSWSSLRGTFFVRNENTSVVAIFFADSPKVSHHVSVSRVSGLECVRGHADWIHNLRNLHNGWRWKWRMEMVGAEWRKREMGNPILAMATIMYVLRGLKFNRMHLIWQSSIGCSSLPL